MFLFLHERRFCGYSLKAPRPDASNNISCKEKKSIKNDVLGTLLSRAIEAMDGSVTAYQPIYAKRPIKRTLANNVDPDQTPQNAASDQGLHCLQ